MAVCAVVGSPIVHSLSPAMHRAAYRELGLDWTYERFDVAGGTLAEFLDVRAGQFRGLSVTAPLKHEAAALAGVRDRVVELTSVANTLVFGDPISAANTDVPGAVAALRERGVDSVESVRILGAGATAVSVMHASAALGASVCEVRLRDLSRAGDVRHTAEQLNISLRAAELSGADWEPVDLLISTLPGHTRSVDVASAVESAAAVFDVAYDPWPSPLVAEALRQGKSAVTGLDLLAHQAVLQVELMTGFAVPAATLRAAAEEAGG